MTESVSLSLSRHSLKKPNKQDVINLLSVGNIKVKKSYISMFLLTFKILVVNLKILICYGYIYFYVMYSFLFLINFIFSHLPIIIFVIYIVSNCHKPITYSNNWIITNKVNFLGVCLL